MSLGDFFVWLGATVGVSGLVSAFVAHRLAISREGRVGRDAFRGHLGRWIGELEALGNPTNAQLREIRMKYSPDFPGYVARIEKSFLRPRKFKRLCEEACKETNMSECREYVVKKVHRIRALLDYI
jgi:hypothetical protein